MEGRILRRQADPQAQPRSLGPAAGRRLSGGCSARRSRSRRRVAALDADAGHGSVADVGVATAEAGKCRWAHASPRHVSRKHARHAVVCQINKKRQQARAERRQHEARAAQGGEAALEVHAAPSLLRAPVPWGEGPRGRGSTPRAISPATAAGAWVRPSPGAAKRRGTPSAIVRAWMHSPAHRHVLLDRGLKNVGIGLVWGSPSNPGRQGGHLHRGLRLAAQAARERAGARPGAPARSRGARHRALRTSVAARLPKRTG